MSEQLKPCPFCGTARLNSGLFWELCKQYDVPLSLDYDDIMLDKNGHARYFKDNDIDRIFAFGNNTGKDNPHVENNMETP